MADAELWLAALVVVGVAIALAPSMLALYGSRQPRKPKLCPVVIEVFDIWLDANNNISSEWGQDIHGAVYMRIASSSKWVSSALTPEQVLSVSSNVEDAHEAYKTASRASRQAALMVTN